MTNMTAKQVREMMKTHIPVECPAISGARDKDGRPVAVLVWQRRPRGQRRA